MATLHRTFALAERDDAAVRVGKNLNFDMARLFQIFFDEDAGLPKAFMASEEHRGMRKGILHRSKRDACFSAAACNCF